MSGEYRTPAVDGRNKVTRNDATRDILQTPHIGHSICYKVVRGIPRGNGVLLPTDAVVYRQFTAQVPLIAHVGRELKLLESQGGLENLSKIQPFVLVTQQVLAQ